MEYVEVIFDSEEVINVILLAVKSPIVNWKSYCKGDVGYYEIHMVDGSCKTYVFFKEMLNDFDREDLIVFYRLFNKNYASTRPGFDDLMLCGDMKIMFEPDDDHEDLAQRMLEEEREILSIEERSRLLAEFIDKRKKMLAAKRAKEKRNKPPTQAQQITYMSNYLKNMGGYTLKQLKQYSFEEIKMLFDNTMESIRMFVLMESEGQAVDSKAGEGSSKAGKNLERSAKEELGQEKKVEEEIAQQEDVVAEQAEKESSKKAGIRLKRKTSKAREDNDKRQKKQDDPEKLTLMEYVEVIFDSEEVINVILLAVKSPIVNWKSYCKGDVGYYEIHMVDGSCKTYVFFKEMLLVLLI
nr:hypothetical protein [Tanacetum cinerariifolium]